MTATTNSNAVEAYLFRDTVDDFGNEVSSTDQLIARYCIGTHGAYSWMTEATNDELEDC